MAKQVIDFKRGDTFELPMVRTTAAGAAVNLTDFTITSQVRVDAFVDDLTIEVTDAAAGEFTLSATAAETADWPVAQINCDVQFVNVSTQSSQTFIINNQEDITRAS